MADELSDADIAMDTTGLYQEETFTDRRVGTLQRLTPITAAGARDTARPILYVGQTQVLTPAGALPLSFEVPATSLDDAVAKFGEMAKQALARTMRRLEELRREQASSIIVPGRGAAGRRRGRPRQPLHSLSSMADTSLDRLAIREVVDNWVLWSDSGDWERFATVWHDDAWMTATWFQGPASAFQEARRAGFERGVSIIHFLGGMTIELAGERAIAQTKMTINQRATVDGVVVDAVCTGRFYDFFAKRNGRWAIVRRQPIYEKDRLDPVEPGTKLALDSALLAKFPEGYRHLGYLQTKAGFNVRLGLPGLRGPEVAKLYAEGAAWLAGSPQPGVPL